MKNAFKIYSMILLPLVLLNSSPLMGEEAVTDDTEENQQVIDEVTPMVDENTSLEEETIPQEEAIPQVVGSTQIRFANEPLMNFRHSAAFLSRHQSRSASIGFALGNDETIMSASSKDVTISKSPFLLDVKGVYPVNQKIWAGFGFLTDSTKISYSNGLTGGKRNWVEIDFAGAYALDEKLTLGLELIQVTATVEENGLDSASASYITFVPSVRYLLGNYEILASLRPSKKTESDDASVRDYGSLTLEGNYFITDDKRLGASLVRVFNKTIDSDGLEDSWDLGLSGRYLLKPELWTGAGLTMRQAKYKNQSYLTEETMGNWSLTFDTEWAWREKQTIGGLFEYTNGNDERVVYSGEGKLDVKFKKSSWLLGVNYKHQF